MMKDGKVITYNVLRTDELLRELRAGKVLRVSDKSR